MICRQPLRSWKLSAVLLLGHQVVDLALSGSVDAVLIDRDLPESDVFQVLQLSSPHTHTHTYDGRRAGLPTMGHAVLIERRLPGTCGGNTWHTPNDCV